MRIPKVDTIDFETDRILPRPEYPPKPVGVAIKEYGKSPVYLCWGHPTENNCSLADAKRQLKKVWKSPNKKLFHNSKFDIDVAVSFMGCKMLDYHQYHDTMFLAFLNNPHSNTLELKKLADELLDLPPDEQSELYNWVSTYVRTSEKSGNGKVILLNNTSVKHGFKIPPSKLGAFIAYAPGNLSGKYAKGDVVRTEKLFKLLYPYIVEAGMLAAYERELRLMPVLLKSEKQGVKVAHARLRKDTTKMISSINIADEWIRKRLRTKDLDVDKKDDVADAIERTGKVDEWILTDKGNRSVARDNIEQCVTDKQLLGVLRYRSLLTNSYRNFARSWLDTADRSDGYIYTSWNQVKQDKDTGKGTLGARTGRITANPNLQGIAKRPPLLITSSEARKYPEDSNLLILPKSILDMGIVGLPNLRSYVTPSDVKKGVILHRDYSQQELRILAHYEDGTLLREYNENPRMDIHQYARDLIVELFNIIVSRRPIKNLGFGLIYGMGLALLASSMNVDRATAKILKKAYLSIFPGLRTLIDDIQDTAKAGEPIHTWGGREYYVEPAMYDSDKGQWRDFYYKLLNVLIQGSAADCTKEAIIRSDSVCKNSDLMITVHDETNRDTVKEYMHSEMLAMRESMESVEFDLPMLSDGKYSFKNWGSLTTYKET